MDRNLECLLTSVFLDVGLWCKLALVEVFFKGGRDDLYAQLQDLVEDL